MISTNTAIASIGIIVASFLGGIAIYYLLDHREKQDKKYQLDQFLNVLMPFILYLWFAKVLFQLPTFVHDPISVLAYPANSVHFLIASVFLLIHTWVKYRKAPKHAADLFQVSSFILLVALFLYEILQLAVKPGAHLITITIVLALLVIIYVFFYGKYKKHALGVLLIGFYLVFACGMAFYRGYFLLFGFMLSPYYILFVILLLLVYAISMHKRK